MTFMFHSHMRLGSLCAALLAACLICFCSSASSAAPDELLQNGSLKEANAAGPTGWRHAAFFSDPKVTHFDWYVDNSGVGVLKITNIKENDARWVQDLPVAPSTWYHVVGWARADNSAPPQALGARLSVSPNGYESADLRGTKPWQRLEFWMKTGADQESMELQCRLGGNSAMAAGIAYFKEISVTQQAPPSTAPARLVFSGTTEARQSGPPGAPGQRKVLVWLFSVILTAGVILLLWRFALPSAWRTPP
jgi:hypothetical protein